MSVRRMLPFIIINIIVSATVVLLILFLWDTRTPGEETAATTEPQATAPVAAGESTPAAAVETQPAQQNSDGQTIHTVQPGESLGFISQQYDVSMEDIMTANGISDPNFIQVNQELIIPVGGLPTETPVPTPSATANVIPTPLPTDPPEEGEAVVEISEVIGPGSLADEAVAIVNSGNRSIALLDWELSDEDGNVYTFGQVTLFGGGGISLHTEAGQDSASDLYWDLEQPIWESGETVTLTDAEGTVRVTYTIP